MKNAPDSKKGRILRHLWSGRSLTHLQAIRLYSHSRLASCVNRLRNEGYDIKTTIIYNLLGEGYAQYHLPKSKEN